MLRATLRLGDMLRATLRLGDMLRATYFGRLTTGD
jgi:hypothetical protein